MTDKASPLARLRSKKKLQLSGAEREVAASNLGIRCCCIPQVLDPKFNLV